MGTKQNNQILFNDLLLLVSESSLEQNGNSANNISNELTVAVCEPAIKHLPWK